MRNKLYDKTVKSQIYYSNVWQFPVPWRSALWLYNTSWLDQNLSKRFLKQLTVSAIKVLVAIHYSVLDARNGYIRNVVV